jgi:hypothetical protein
MHRIRAIAIVTLISLSSSSAMAQDRITFRDRATKGLQMTSGKIDSESIAGVKIGSRTIPAADIADIVYDVAAIKLDYPRATAAENRGAAEAGPMFETMLRMPAVQNNKGLKTFLEYKVAMLAATRADESRDQHQKALAALARFKGDHPDSWEMVPVTRTIARLALEQNPPDYDAARKAYQDLAAAPGAPPEIKLESDLQAIDVLLLAGKTDEARQKAASLPSADARTKVYQIGCQTGPDAAKQLEEMIDKTSDRVLKASAYNMLGDVYRRDAKKKKDALYAYLWVDVVYNDDPAEVAKADARLASLFGEFKDEDRAKKYRDKARGK